MCQCRVKNYKPPSAEASTEASTEPGVVVEDEPMPPPPGFGTGSHMDPDDPRAEKAEKADKTDKTDKTDAFEARDRAREVEPPIPSPVKQEPKKGWPWKEQAIKMDEHECVQRVMTLSGLSEDDKIKAVWECERSTLYDAHYEKMVKVAEPSNDGEASRGAAGGKGWREWRGVEGVRVVVPEERCRGGVCVVCVCV